MIFLQGNLKQGAREMDMDERHFISPCDCRLSVYPIEPQMEVTIKNTCYTVGSLLRDEEACRAF